MENVFVGEMIQCKSFKERMEVTKRLYKKSSIQHLGKNLLYVYYITKSKRGVM